MGTAETHISALLFLGERAYKFPKPVRFAFLDQSTVAKRVAVCEREVELNRRLAPDVYVGTGELSAGGADPEPCIVMRRMPEARRLSTIVRATGGQDDPGLQGRGRQGPGQQGRGQQEIRAVARRLAAFHAGADRGPHIDSAADPEAVRALWDDNLNELVAGPAATTAGEQLDVVASLAHRYLDGRGPLLEHRQKEGSVCDGHGDLLADDIFCLPDGPRILDCLAFADRLRHGDVLLDLAFLAMDLEHLGAPERATQLLADYAEFSGEHHPASLAHHYIAYRALVRAKIAWLRAADEQMAALRREQFTVEAHGLLDLCDRHLDSGRVRLVVVGGPPGTGKSTLARGIADARGWPVLSSDELRKQMAGRASSDHRIEHLDEGLYSPARSADTYASLLAKARSLLGLGESVVLDASWSSADDRASVRRLADETHSDLDELHCVVAPAVARGRVRARASLGADPSDVDERLLEPLTARFEPWPEATVIDTDRPVAEVAANAMDLMGMPSGIG